MGKRKYLYGVSKTGTKEGSKESRRKNKATTGGGSEKREILEL
jgi:hypothetical protein